MAAMRPALDREIGRLAGGTGAVEQQAAADEDIVAHEGGARAQSGIDRAMPIT